MTSEDEAREEALAERKGEARRDYDDRIDNYFIDRNQNRYEKWIWS